MKEKRNHVTRKMVNDALRARGRDWLSSSVMVKRISDLTLEQWLKEFDSLLDRDKKVRRQMAVPVKKQSKSR
jgi:hypothetical protein